MKMNKRSTEIEMKDNDDDNSKSDNKLEGFLFPGETTTKKKRKKKRSKITLNKTTPIPEKIA